MRDCRRHILVLLLCAVASIGLVTAVWAQLGSAGKIRGFRLPEFYQTDGGARGPLKTLITGAEAQPNASGSVAVTEMRIQTYEEQGATNIIARAPQCQVDLGNRLVWSTGRLEVATANGQFFTEGQEGFFCRMSNTVLILSNRVRTVIGRQLVEARTHENKTN
jgi:hypothetical protein